jgi:alkylation response protein AidB-like acyl-CoA dehydrogenase
MDLALKPEHKAFADEVRAFVHKNLSPATRQKTFSGKHYDRDDHMAWQQALGRQGWLAYTWPKKYGGPVNGQKTWTSFAHWGDWIFCLVRTNPDAKPQEGISFLLIDMKTPGVTVRPIIMLDGAHHVNDVFLDNVKVPVENRIGKEGEGWTCAKFLLANERLGIAEVPASKRGVRSLRDIARREPADGTTLAHDPAFTAQIADLDLQVQALEMSELRALSAMAQGGAPGPEVSTLKIRGSEIQQRIAELAMEAVGEYAQPYQPCMLFHDTNETPVGPDHAPPAAPRYFNMRKTSIYGGSNEIQKNIVSKMVLGL